MPGSHRPPTRLARAVVYLLFAAVAIVALWVPFYNRAAPALFGIPFFYWFQFAWIVMAAVSTAIAYKLRL